MAHLQNQCFVRFKYERCDNWIEERGGRFIQKSFGFVLIIGRQEGSYAGCSLRAMLKDISNPRMPRPKTTNTPSSSQEMIKRFLLKAILIERGNRGVNIFHFPEMLPSVRFCNVVGRSIAQGYQLCNYWQELGRTMNYLICQTGSLRHKTESEGFITPGHTPSFIHQQRSSSCMFSDFGEAL